MLLFSGSWCEEIVVCKKLSSLVGFWGWQCRLHQRTITKDNILSSLLEITRGKPINTAGIPWFIIIIHIDVLFYMYLLFSFFRVSSLLATYLDLVSHSLIQSTVSLNHNYQVHQSKHLHSLHCIIHCNLGHYFDFLSFILNWKCPNTYTCATT